MKKIAPGPMREYPRKPRFKLPPGACDCHFHIVGPYAEFPPLEKHPLSFADIRESTLDHWLAMQEATGLQRGVHVASMSYGDRYDLVLHSLRRLPGRLRGVIGPWLKISDAELQSLDDAGVVGVRFSSTTASRIDKKVSARAHEFGWASHYLYSPEALENWAADIKASPGRFVLEHLGRPVLEEGVDGESFRFVLDCLDTARCWVKLSTRFSEKPFPHDDLVPFIEKLLQHAPDRLLWGSDWPHVTDFESTPDDVAAIDLIGDWVSDPEIRRRLFVQNPIECFGFPEVENVAAH